MKQIDISSAGDHFFVGLQPSPKLTPHDRSLLAGLRPAGVILFKSNFVHGVNYEEWLASLSRLIGDIRLAGEREKLVIAIDHESGRVCRIPEPMTRFAYASQWAGQAAAVGAAMGSELSSLGVNLSFAPVLDINNNPTNPVIGARSFGADSDQVTAAALAFMASMQNEGVLACGKHLPGHGDTDTDSHYAFPILRQDLAALKARELKPFVAAVQAKIPMIVTGHMFLPAIDPIDTVTLSQRFTREILRRALGFDGVVTTDDIGMRAVSTLFEDVAAAMQAVSAGTDMLMVFSHWTDTDRCRGFADALIQAKRSGLLSGDLIDRSQERIHTLLARSKANEVVSLSDTRLAAHRKAGKLFSAETVEVI